MRLKTFGIYLILTIVFSLLFLEVLIRTFLFQPNLVFNHFYTDGNYIFTAPNVDDVIAIVPRDSNFKGTQIKQYKVPVRTNQYGHRDTRNFAFEKPKDKTRILSLGGSIAFGWPYPFENSYSALLENLIPNSEVINAAHVAASAAHMWEYYRKIGRKFSPDILLIQMRPTEMPVDDLVQDKFGENAYEIDFLKRNGIANPDFASLSQEAITKLQESFQLGSPLRFWLNKYSHLVRLLNYSIASRNSYFKNYIKTDFNNVENQKREIEPTLSYITQISDLAKKNNTKVIFLIVPNRFGCSYPVTKPWLELITKLKKSKTNYISFLDYFCDLTAHQSKTEKFLSDEYHPKKEEYEFIAEKIRQNYLGY